MEKQIKMSFLLLASTLLLFDVQVYIVNVVSGYAQATTTEMVIFFLFVLFFIFFIASYISNVVRYLKDKGLRKYLAVLTLAIFFILSIFLAEFFNIYIEKRHRFVYISLFQFFLLIASIIVYTNKTKSK